MLKMQTFTFRPKNIQSPKQRYLALNTVKLQKLSSLFALYPLLPFRFCSSVFLFTTVKSIHFLYCHKASNNIKKGEVMVQILLFLFFRMYTEPAATHTTANAIAVYCGFTGLGNRYSTMSNIGIGL